MTTSRGYLVCCIERTGSNLLADSLTATRIAGRPWEYFNPVGQSKDQMRAILGESFLVDGFDKVLAAGTTPNGVFAAKIHWSHFRFLGLSATGEWSPSMGGLMYKTMRSRLPELLTEEATDELLSPYFADLKPHATALEFVSSRVPALNFVWLRRRNMVARAISLFRARSTNIWYKSKAQAETEQDEPPCTFDLAEIHIWNRIGGFEERLWQRFFEMHGISPHVMYYEDLVAAHDESVRGVLKFLGLQIGDSAIQMPRCVKQSGDESLQWELRYRESVVLAKT